MRMIHIGLGRLRHVEPSVEMTSRSAQIQNPRNSRTMMLSPRSMAKGYDRAAIRATLRWALRLPRRGSRLAL